MSRLESMRRRLGAQIDGINWAARKIAQLDGDVLELGLGNGRSYDHLRQELPERRIWVIDRILNCHSSCVPPAENFLKGEAEDKLFWLAGKGRKMALAHYDFGYGDKQKDEEEGLRLSPLIASLMQPGGLVLSQQPLVGFEQIAGPDTVVPDRYLFYCNL